MVYDCVGDGDVCNVIGFDIIWIMNVVDDVVLVEFLGVVYDYVVFFW